MFLESFRLEDPNNSRRSSLQLGTHLLFPNFFLIDSLYLRCCTKFTFLGAKNDLQRVVTVSNSLQMVQLLERQQSI